MSRLILAVCLMVGVGCGKRDAATAPPAPPTPSVPKRDQIIVELDRIDNELRTLRPPMKTMSPGEAQKATNQAAKNATPEDQAKLDALVKRQDELVKQLRELDGAK